jgi:flagellar biosynthesis anti-sigma factor FlgM
MKIEDPRSVTPSPVLRPAIPAAAPRPEAKPARTETAPSAAQQPAARVELSARSQELHRALAAADAAPDVRADKVADAKQRIAQGTYTVNADVVARGILDTRA